MKSASPIPTKSDFIAKRFHPQSGFIPHKRISLKKAHIVLSDKCVLFSGRATRVAQCDTTSDKTKRQEQVLSKYNNREMSGGFLQAKRTAPRLMLASRQRLSSRLCTTFVAEPRGRFKTTQHLQNKKTYKYEKLYG